MGYSKDQVKQAVCSAIDRHREKVIALGENILHNPELGFKEIETARLVAQTLRELGLEPREGLALTGVKAIAGGRPGPAVAIIGEMDALINYDYPFSNPQTGAAHCCGHHAQVASMLGSAIGLLESGAMAYLAGSVVFFAVPAEEFIEIEYRLHLRQQGRIEFLGGKQELIRLGEFDDIHLAMMVHSATVEDRVRLGVGGQGLAFVSKHIQYRGQTAHAALAPSKGVNALNAALLGLLAIHAQRETFLEADHVRIHPIITRGGDVVNAVPDDVRIETYVRAASNQGLLDANAKLDRALQAGAMAIGAEVQIRNMPGYLPIVNHPELSDLFAQNAVSLVGSDAFEDRRQQIETVSGDMGDVGHIMPTVSAFAAGWQGRAHTDGYLVQDKDLAYILPAKAMAMTAVDLLWHDAQAAEHLLHSSTPLLNRAQYLDLMRNLWSESHFPANPPAGTY